MNITELNKTIRIRDAAFIRELIAEYAVSPYRDKMPHDELVDTLMGCIEPKPYQYRPDEVHWTETILPDDGRVLSLISQPPVPCSHSWVNASFMHMRRVCKHCDANHPEDNI